MYTLDICMYMYTKFCVTVVFCLENVRMHEESGSSLNSTWHFNSLMVNIVFRKLVIEWSYFSMWRWFLNHLRVCFTCFFLVSIKNESIKRLDLNLLKNFADTPCEFCHEQYYVLVYLHWYSDLWWHYQCLKELLRSCSKIIDHFIWDLLQGYTEGNQQLHK